MRLAIGRRLHRFWEARTFRLHALGWDNIRVEKGSESQVRPLVQRILRNARSNPVRRHARRIESDKRDLIQRLASVKTDPAPLEHTFYETEGAAVVGCASPEHGGTLLYSVVRAIESQRVVEIGTAHGYGAVYIGSALNDLGRGRLLTTEGMYVRVKHSRETIQRLGVAECVEVVEGDFRETVPVSFTRLRPVDLVFLDGDKSVELTRSHFELCLEEMTEGGYAFFDDIDFDDDIAQLWRELVAHDRVVSCLTFYGRWALLRIEGGH